MGEPYHGDRVLSGEKNEVRVFLSCVSRGALVRLLSNFFFLQNHRTMSPLASLERMSSQAPDDVVLPMDVQSHISRVIDVLRFPLIALVVLFHAFICLVTLPAGAYDWHQPVTAWVYWRFLHDSVATAAVPLFFAISGFLYFNRVVSFDGKVWRKKTLARMFRLGIPLLAWTVLALLFYATLYFLGASNTAAQSMFESAHGIWWWINAFLGLTAVMGPHLNPAGWFVRDLFFVGLLSPLWYLLLRRKCLMFILLGALFILYMTVFAPLPFLGSRAMFFFCLGASYAIHHRDFTADAERIMWPCAVLWLLGFIAVQCWDIPYLPSLLPILVIPMLLGGVSRGVRKGWFQPVPWLAASAFFVYFGHVSMWLRVPLHYFLVHLFVPYSDWACLGFIMLKWVLETVLCVAFFLLLRRFMPITLVLLAGIRQTKPRSRSRD